MLLKGKIIAGEAEWRIKYVRYTFGDGTPFISA